MSHSHKCQKGKSLIRNMKNLGEKGGYLKSIKHAKLSHKKCTLPSQSGTGCSPSLLAQRNLNSCRDAAALENLDP